MQNRINSLNSMIAEREALLTVTPLCNETELACICEELESLETLRRDLETAQRQSYALAALIVESEFSDLTKN